MNTIQTADTLKILAEANRLNILHVLNSEEICVCKLAARINITHNLLSFHLKTLLDKGILKKRREGNQFFYFINPEWEDKINQLFNIFNK